MAKSRKGRGVFIPLVIVVALVLVAADVFPIRQLIAHNRQADEVRARLVEVQDENAQLEREIQTLRSSAEIERIARADFGYVRPGELSYAVIVAEEQPVDNADVLVPELAPESGGFWESLWDYLTGRDVSDG